MKAAIVAVVVAVLGFGCWSGFKFNQVSKLNDQLNEQLMQAKLEIGKAHTQFGDAQNQIELLDRQLQDEIKAHKELITKYGILKAKYDASGGGNGTVVVPGNTVVVVEGPEFIPGNIYVAQDKSLVSSFTTPIKFSFSDQRLAVDVSIFTTFNDGFVLSSDFKYNLRLNIMTQLVETITESGAVNNYVNVFEVDERGNKIGKFELASFEVIVQDQRKSKLHWFNPKIDVGLFAAFTGDCLYGGNLGVSLSSYGLTRNDLTWRFARFGVAVHNKGIAFDFSPVLWNIGGPLPIVQNLWVSPGLIFDVNTRKFGITGSLGVSL